MAGAGLILLDRDPHVVAIASQPFWLHWHGTRKRRHAPDYFVRLSDGGARIVDVRPEDEMDEATREAFNATRHACRAVGWDTREGCGAPIQSEASFGVKPLTCSRASRQKRHRKRHPASQRRRERCRICRKVMVMRIGQRRPLCSSACRRAAYLERQQRRTPQPEAPSGPEAEASPLCLICEVPLPPNAAESGRRTCSQRCRQAAYRWRTSPPRPTRPSVQPWNPTPTPLGTCEVCGHPLPPGPGRRRTCSGRCRQRAHRWRTHPSEEHRTQQAAPESPNPNPPPEPAASPITVGARADALAPTRNESPEMPPCTVCLGPLPEGRSRSQRRTCSQRCRQKAYRQRKAMLL
ncbi:TnsA endonuclease N-terminal domain-containing protein [Streptomyces thermocoprophilus]|uniref:TnsA endonuclease N-terminal domain-containing protein n=1 Tax=Streptomyces thermocoprophilus TaxID=78356 RepID=A0ABV5VND7_9ACTN